MFYSSRFRSLELQLDCGNIFWSVVQGRRLNPSSAVGVCVFFQHWGLRVLWRSHSHVSILSMFTAPHAYKLVFTTLHSKGHYCLQCLWNGTNFWDLKYYVLYAFCFGVNKIYLFIHFLKRKKFIRVSTTAISIWLKVTVKTLIISQNISVLNKCFSYEEYCIEMYHGFHNNIKQHSSFLILIIFKK